MAHTGPGKGGGPGKDDDGGTVNTGDATVADVAVGKTFSSALLTNATGTSTKNATVPSGEIIEPAQAFVGYAERLTTFCLDLNLSMDFSNLGIESLIAADIAGIFDQFGNPIDLNGNLLTGATQEDLLTEMVALGSSGGSIDISNNLEPYPLLVFQVDLSTQDASGPGTWLGGGNVGIGGNFLLVFDSGQALAASSVDFTGLGNFLTVGTSDSPTKQQVINKIVAISGGKITDAGGFIFVVAPTDQELEPVLFNGGLGPASAITQGGNSVGTLRSRGWTVTID